MTTEINGAAPAPPQTREQAAALQLAQWVFNTMGVFVADALIDGALAIVTTLRPSDPRDALPANVAEIVATGLATKRARDAARSTGIVIAPAGLNVRKVLG